MAGFKILRENVILSPLINIRRLLKDELFLSVFRIELNRYLYNLNLKKYTWASMKEVRNVDIRNLISLNTSRLDKIFGTLFWNLPNINPFLTTTHLADQLVR